MEFLFYIGNNSNIYFTRDMKRVDEASSEFIFNMNWDDYPTQKNAISDIGIAVLEDIAIREYDAHVSVWLMTFISVLLQINDVLAEYNGAKDKSMEAA